MVDLNDYWVFTDASEIEREFIKILIPKKSEIISIEEYGKETILFKSSVIHFWYGKKSVIVKVKETIHEVKNIIGNKYFMEQKIKKINKEIENDEKYLESLKERLENLKKRRDELVG